MNAPTRYILSIGLVSLLTIPSAVAMSDARFVRSDFNDDGVSDVSDAISTLHYLFLGRFEATCLDAGDANDDGVLDVSDAIFSLDFNFLGGATLPQPFPACGEDPTPDELTCASTRCADGAPNILEALGHCGGVPASDYPNSLKEGAALYRVTIDAPGAICNDGSPAVMYVRPARPESPHATRWVLYLQGGGGCQTLQDCTERWCSVETVFDESKMSSRYTPSSIAGTGIFSRSLNNTFGEFNQVYFYYCSSDSWAGQASDVVLQGDEEAGDLPFSVHFRGHTILEAALGALLRGDVVSDDGEVEMPPLDSAQLVLISGFSAGSGGVRNNGDWMASVLESHGTDVRLVFDASFPPPAGSYPDTLTEEQATELVEGYTTHVRERFAVASKFDPFVDESAASALAGNDNEWRVGDSAYVALNHITTPFFVHIDLGDRGTRELYGSWGVSPHNLAHMLARTLRALPSLPLRAAEGAAMRQAPGSFGTFCGDHVGLTNSRAFFERTVEGPGGVPHSFHDALVSWLEGHAVALVDDPDAPTTRCGPPQEENE